MFNLIALQLRPYRVSFVEKRIKLDINGQTPPDTKRCF
jgi:hypothetical protein